MPKCSEQTLSIPLPTGGYVELYCISAPETCQPARAALFLHGGGFTGGSILQFGAAARTLAANCSCLSVLLDYHLAPAAHFPQQIGECLAAVEWLQRERAIAPARICLIGGSPGGNIGLMSMLADSALCRRCGFAGSLPRHGIFLNAIYDFEDFWTRNPAEQENVRAYFGTEPDAAALRSASPLRQYCGGALDLLLMHGTADKIVPPEQCAAFAQRINRSGRAQIKWYHGKPHAWFNDSREMRAVISAMQAYVGRI